MDDELWDLLASTVGRSGLELLDLEVRQGLVRVVVDGPGGAHLDAIAEATRSVSAALDSHDPLPGHRYTLEVSSPGVERPLRTPRHFARAVGEKVTVRTVSGDPGERRLTGELVSADDEGFVLEVAGDERRHYRYDEVERARTVFEWGPADRSGGSGSPSRHRGGGGGSDRKKVTTP